MFKAVRLKQATHHTAKVIDGVQLDPALYQGERNENGLPHGFGKYSYAQGDIYEGYWVDGSKQGKGKRSFNSTHTYQFKYLLFIHKRNLELCEWRSVCW